MNDLTLPDPAPLYLQVREALRARILDGSLRQHARLPSESALMAQFGVSRITVRQALNDLAKEGLIFKLAGKGSYVSKPRPVQNLSRLQGFGEAMSSLGYRTSNRLVSLAEVAAPAEIAARFGLDAGAPLTEIRRVRHVDTLPVALDVSYVLPALGARLAREDLATRDIFLILENDYSIALGHADVAIDALGASPEQGALLQVPAGAPLLHIERMTFARDATPLEFDHLYYRGDAFRYQGRIERG